MTPDKRFPLTRTPMGPDRTGENTMLDRNYVVVGKNIHEIPIDQLMDMPMLYFSGDTDLRPSTAYIPGCVNRAVLKLKGADAVGTALRKMICHGQSGVVSKFGNDLRSMEKMRVELLKHPNLLVRYVVEKSVFSFPSLRADIDKVTYRLPGEVDDIIKAHLVDCGRLTKSDAIALCIAASASTASGADDDILACAGIYGDWSRYLANLNWLLNALKSESYDSQE